MEYNSFYGGRRGASFVIVKNYSSINEMINLFQQGSNYKVVNYDEYVLIDTENKNNPDNGKIFRRGYDYNNEMGGAIYEGQIVGPSGLAPALEMTTIEDVKNKQEREGYEYRWTEGEYGPDKNLIPGKIGTNFNDKIEWACCSVRDEYNKDTIAYIGFKFPYLVVDYIAESVNPYYNRDSQEKDFKNIDLSERIDNQEHPFYEKWKFSIPKGIKGDSLKNFRLITANNNVQHYIGQEDDIEFNRKILVYDYYNYDKNANGDPVTIYLGDYNTIKNINMLDDGTFTIEYTHDDKVTFNKKIKWINNFKIDENTSKLTVTYNTGEIQNIEEPINYILKTAISESYHLLVLYSDPIKRQEAISSGKNATYEGRNDWYDLGYIGNGTGVGAIIGKETDSNIKNIVKTMPPYSAWLILED